jgi:hypothetical protein
MLYRPGKLGYMDECVHATAAAGTRQWAASWLSDPRRHNIETAIALE